MCKSALPLAEDEMDIEDLQHSQRNVCVCVSLQLSLPSISARHLGLRNYYFNNSSIKRKQAFFWLFAVFLPFLPLFLLSSIFQQLNAN